MEEDINECGGSLEEIGTSFTSSEPRSRIENAEQAYVIASQQKKKKKLFRRKILPLPKPKKIFKRGLYELMWGAKKRDYGERCSPKKGKRREL